MNIEPIYQVGKASLTPELTQGLDEALESRELIKVTVLKNCLDDPNEIARTVAERTRSEVIQVIGKKFVLYRESKTKKKIELPK
ncbi:RNA-binding protein [Anaerocolumna xylanovorans DSM 12503]|uniref:RNA-binding protein n=2 Tax=Anaerocolumna TaxID=1843210 RepID=A0A1M7Y1T7_9FIRM|nr:RNA-binding protein [Anaerocolumna xylanovorans DSM 12503]